MKLVGVDPGLEGALSLIDTEAKMLHVHGMPTWERVTSATEKTLVDADRLAALLEIWCPDEIWIEDVWSSPQMGPVSAFSFGEGKGILKGVLAARKIKPQWVPPSAWKGQLKISADKPIAKRQAHLVFPACKKLLSSADKAESALIALYGLLTNHPALVKTSFPLRPGPALKV